ncbi:hypothetical protein PVMG_03888 [Plasmodium vivax Mauritania I]|uniref:Erythrocyte membrane protein n=1 Tax=Plasmodium vivax Mauritania I TaxID=1035515 RepID=A0A0J9TKN4_PLAVI|nr:hypothetical protein PVMG_03888 [Plasmodium vivax Mauritania I]
MNISRENSSKENNGNGASSKKAAKNSGTAKGSDEKVKDSGSVGEEKCGERSNGLEQNQNEKSQAKCVASVKKEEDGGTSKGDELKAEEGNQDDSNQKDDKEEDKKKKKKNNKLPNVESIDNGSGAARKKESQCAEGGSVEKGKAEEGNNASVVITNDNVSGVGVGVGKSAPAQGHGKGVKEKKFGNKPDKGDPSGSSAYYNSFNANNDWRSSKNNSSNGGNHGSSNHGGNLDGAKNNGVMYQYAKGNSMNGEHPASRDKQSDYNSAAAKDPNKKRNFVKSDSKNFDGGYGGNANNGGANHGGANNGNVGGYPGKANYKYDYKNIKNGYNMKGGKNYKVPPPSALSSNVSGNGSGNVSGNASGNFNANYNASYNANYNANYNASYNTNFNANYNANYNANFSANFSGVGGVGGVGGNSHNGSSLNYDGFNNHGSSNNPGDGMVMDPMSNMVMYNNSNSNYNYLPNYGCNYPYSYYVDENDGKSVEASNYYSSSKVYGGAASSGGGAATGSSAGVASGGAANGGAANGGAASGGAASGGGTGGGVSGTTPPAAASTSATASAGSSAATTGAVGPDGYNNDGNYDARFNYNNMVNDFYNYLPFNYYYYNMNSMYFGGSNYNANAHSPYHDGLKNRKGKKYLYEKNKKKNYKNMTSSNMYSEIKNRVIEIFRRENIMTDDYLLYFMYNNVKLSIDVIAKHPYISPLVSSNAQNNTAILANVLNDLKCINLGKKEGSGGDADKAVEDKAVEDKAVADKAVADKAVADKAVADKAVADKAVADKAVADKAVADKAAADKAVADKAMADPDAAALQGATPQVVTTNGNGTTNGAGVSDPSSVQDGEEKQQQRGGEPDKGEEVKVVAPPADGANAEGSAKDASSLKREDNVVESDATEANGKGGTVAEGAVEEAKDAVGGSSSSTPAGKSKGIEGGSNDKGVEKGSADVPSSLKIAFEEDNKNFLLNLNNKRNVIIVRDISSHYINTVKSIVLSSPNIQPTDVLSVRNDVNNTIFITLRNEKKTEALAKYLKTKSVNDKKLNVRIKTTQRIQNIIENNIFKSVGTVMGSSNNVSGSSQVNTLTGAAAANGTASGAAGTTSGTASGGSGANASAMGTSGRGVINGVSGAAMNGGSTHGGSAAGTGVGSGSISSGVIGSLNSSTPNGVPPMASSSSTVAGGSSTTNNAATATSNGSITGTASGSHLNMMAGSGMPMGPKQYMNFHNMYYLPNAMNGYDSSLYGHGNSASNAASNYDAYLNYYNYGMSNAGYNMYQNVTSCDSFGGGYNMYSNAYGQVNDMKSKHSYNNNKGGKFFRGGGDGNNMGRVSDNNFNIASMPGSLNAGASQGAAGGAANNPSGYYANAYGNYGNVFSNMYSHMYGSNMHGGNQHGGNQHGGNQHGNNPHSNTPHSNTPHSNTPHSNNQHNGAFHEGGVNGKGDKYLDDVRKFHHMEGPNEKGGMATSGSATSHHHNRMNKGGKDADSGKGSMGAAVTGSNANSKNNRGGANENGGSGGKNNRSRSSSNCNSSAYNGNNNNNNNNSGNNNGHGASSNSNGSSGNNRNGTNGGGGNGAANTTSHGSGASGGNGGGSSANGGSTGSGGGSGNNCSSNNKSAMKTNGEYSKSGSNKLSKKDSLVRYDSNGSNSVLGKGESKALDKKSGKNYYNKKNGARKNGEKKGENKKDAAVAAVASAAATALFADLTSNEVAKMKDERRKAGAKLKEDDNCSEAGNQADHPQQLRKKPLEVGEACEANEEEEAHPLAQSGFENDPCEEKHNEESNPNEEENGKCTDVEKSEESNNQHDDVVNVERKSKKDYLSKNEQLGSNDVKDHSNRVSPRIGAAKKSFANKIATNKDKGAVNSDEKKAPKNKNKVEEATVNGGLVNGGMASGGVASGGIATNDNGASGNTQNRKKYSYVDIMDSCKKLTNVDAPPECIDKLMKENVSLFRKRDDQFCWKLNVF